MKTHFVNKIFVHQVKYISKNSQHFLDLSNNWEMFNLELLRQNLYRQNVQRDEDTALQNML